MKVAIVHDWLVGGGAEKVVLELHKMFPEAPIYTSYATQEWRDKLDGKVVTGFLQHWPFSRLRKFLPVLRIWWFTHLKFTGYDMVISSTGNGEAKGVRVPQGTKHVCYCNTPTHFYWRHYEQYLKQPGFGLLNPLARLGLRLLVKPLRAWDLKASKRPHVFIANSTHIQKEIQTFYGRESTVIHPPVDMERFIPVKTGSKKGFVTVGRLVPQKRVDIIVEACTKLNLPLKVIGRGPELKNLKKLAGPTVEFLTDVSDADLPAHLAGAEAFIFAAYEDFGIAPVEALAAGTPVIAYKAGGSLDYVVEEHTGIFFDKQTVEALIKALQIFSLKDYSPKKIQEAAISFSTQRFHTELLSFLEQLS